MPKQGKKPHKAAKPRLGLGKKAVNELKKTMEARLSRRSILLRAAMIGGIALALLSIAFLGLSWVLRSRAVLVSGLPVGSGEAAEFQKFAQRIKGESGLHILVIDRKGSVRDAGGKGAFLPLWRRPDLSFLKLDAGVRRDLSSGAFRNAEGAIALMEGYSPAPALAPYLEAEGKRYLIPARIDPWVLYAQPAQLQALRRPAPTTVDEMLAVGRALRASRRSAASGGDASGSAYAPMVLAGADADALLAWPSLMTSAAGGGAEALVQAMDRMRSLGKEGFFHPASRTSAPQEALDLLASGAATWSILPLSLVDSLPLAARRGITPALLPLTGDTVEDSTVMMAALDAWAIPAKAPNPKAAQRALAAVWSSKELRFFAYASARLPGNTRTVARNEEAQALRDAVNWAKDIMLPPSAGLDGASLEGIATAMREAIGGD